MKKREKEKFYIATAIAYASKRPHLGNDYEIIYADAIARYKKIRGFDVFFLTGTDEHGQKVEEQAKLTGKTPQEYANEISNYIYDTYKKLNINFDKFIKTTDDYHVEAVTKIFTKLYKNGDIYKSNYSGMYCVPCESFYTPSQIEKENICPECGATLMESKEEAYYLRLSKYQEKLEKYIEENPTFIFPESRKREIVNNFIKPGLQDLCVSRSTIKWGVPVEFDEGHVIHVWTDALSNYITALGYNPDNNGETELFQKYWPCDVHMVGKDIMRFHTISWPIILWGLGLTLPKQVFGHPWVLYGEDKMSKSKGNVINTSEFIARFGTDAVRYYVLSEMPYAQDGSLTYENFVKKFNSDLVNTLGNLLNRTVAMAEKYFNSHIETGNNSIIENELDTELIDTVKICVEKYTQCMDEFKVAEAIEVIIKFLSRANKYIDETKPWILGNSEKAEDRNRLQIVLYNLLECIRIGAVLFSPIIPQTSENIFSQINTNEKSFESISVFGTLERDIAVKKGEPLFMRLDEKALAVEFQAKFANTAKKTEIEIEKVKEEQKKSEEVKEITIDDFMNIYLKVVKVVECEPVAKSDKLLKLQVDTGSGIKQVVSGIAKFYTPSDLIGKKLILVDNLKEVKLRGVLSQGMILASGEDDVKVLFADEDAEIGTRVR